MTFGTMPNHIDKNGIKNNMVNIRLSIYIKIIRNLFYSLRLVSHLIDTDTPYVKIQENLQVNSKMIWTFIFKEAHVQWFLNWGNLPSEGKLPFLGG